MANSTDKDKKIQKKAAFGLPEKTDNIVVKIERKTGLKIGDICAMALIDYTERYEKGEIKF